MRVFTCLLLGAVSFMGTSLRPALGFSPGPQEELKDVFDEAPPPTSERMAAAREAKSRRYDTGGPDITVDAGGIEQIWPRVDLGESAVIVVGTVSSRQSYLSHDRSRIFTELVVDIESLLKMDSDFDPSANSVTLDRLGRTCIATTAKSWSDNGLAAVRL